jgi:hypothetical protein
MLSSFWLKKKMMATTKQEDEENDDLHVIVFLVDKSCEGNNKAKGPRR